LESIGRQLTAAAHELGGANRQLRSRRVRSLIALPVVAAAAVAAVLITGAGTSTAPAYALTHNPDGSITVTLHDLTTGIPQLNAKFKQMGINETVIPVEANCTTLGLVAGPGSMDESVTLSPGHANLSPGDVGVLAAEELPDGQIAIGIGATRPPLPACFSPKAISTSSTAHP
jgi:hypothetical protein